MRILGIDPGLERTGFAVLVAEGATTRLLDCGRIFTPKSLAFPERLRLLAEDLKSLLAEWKPQAAAVEELFFSKNVKTAISVSHARGVIVQTLQQAEVPVHELNPSEIKIALTGTGRADKRQMQKMLELLLARSFDRDDAADAVACALCYAHKVMITASV